MKRYMTILIILVLGIVAFGEQVQGQDTGNESKQGEEKDNPEVKFFKQLISLTSAASDQKDWQKQEEIKVHILDLIRGNLFLSVELCNGFINEAVKNDLAFEGKLVEKYFKYSYIIAQLYEKGGGNSYLMDRLAMVRKWSKEEKEKYLEANRFCDLGSEARELYKYKVALDYYNKSIAICREINYKEGEANSLKTLGDIHRLLAEYEKARHEYEEGLIIYREIKARLGEANSLFSLGHLYLLLSDYEKARGNFEEGLEIYRKIKTRLGEANALSSIGEVHIILSEYEKARGRLEEALIIFQEVKDRLGEANTLKSLGVMHLQLSEYKQARERYEQGLAICREIKNKSGEADDLLRIGDLHRILSEYEKARERYEQSLAIFREIKDRLGEANCLKSLGHVHWGLSEYEKARQRYEQGLAVFREIKERLGEANTLKSLGDVHRMLNEYEKAQASYEQGLTIFREIKAKLGEANCLHSLGETHLQLSEYEKARGRYEQGLAIFRQIKERFGEANTLKSLGDVNRLLTENEKARPYYEEALSLQKKIGDRGGIVRSYNGLGETFEAMNKFSTAEKEYINSIDTTEAVWEEMKREEFKSSYLTSNIFPYENLIRLLVKQDKGPLAFQYAERSRSRSFLYLLGNKRIDIKKGVPLALVRQEEELRQKIAGLAGQIMDNEKKEPGRRSSPAQFNNEMLQLKQTHSETLEKMKLQCPEYANMISVNPLSLEDIQTLIRQTGNTVFLEYYTTPDAAYLWVLDGKDIFPYKIDISKENLHKKVLQFYNMIATPDTFGVPTIQFQARELYNLLLKPAETHLTGKSRIGVIPHGVLHYLPFEALMNNGKFLAEQDMRFFYLPSASVYKFCRDKNPLKKEQLIALGNPDGSLVWAEKEVEELKSLYNLVPRIYIGKDATETQARTDGPSADILHFSCHGVFDSDHPMYSALKLAPDSKEDGNLDVQEIFQLELKPAYLVTLSACQTHVGKINSGDEIVVMSRAFIYAGAPSIVASLWNVDPDYTEKLMVSFYRALKNTDKIEALHQARKEMMETYGKRHPFYWAPFVLMGDFR